jgi:Cu(I)/Ag(I) efflux system protein CusF
MQTKSRLPAVAALLLAIGFAGASLAQNATSAAPAAAATAELTDGEIRKVDKSSKKLTIKHGEIKNIGMPGMTMLFQVRDPAMLDQVKAGDKVKFQVESKAGALIVTEIHVQN